MHIGTGDSRLTDKFVFHINRNMILASKEIIVVLSCPMGIGVFLSLLGFFFASSRVVRNISQSTVSLCLIKESPTSSMPQGEYQNREIQVDHVEAPLGNVLLDSSTIEHYTVYHTTNN